MIVFSDIGRSAGLGCEEKGRGTGSGLSTAKWTEESQPPAARAALQDVGEQRNAVISAFRAGGETIPAGEGLRSGARDRTRTGTESPPRDFRTRYSFRC